MLQIVAVDAIVVAGIVAGNVIVVATIIAANAIVIASIVFRAIVVAVFQFYLLLLLQLLICCSLPYPHLWLQKAHKYMLLYVPFGRQEKAFLLTCLLLSLLTHKTRFNVARQKIFTF